jgi:hypothetical protein
MKFYYENSMGDRGAFVEKDIIKAIYTSWNIEANLYLVNGFNDKVLIFAPWEGNELNSDLLKEYGYYMEDDKEERVIKELSTGRIVKYDWSEVKQLI